MSKLFEPFQLGSVQLANRIVMAPMTRSRANTEGIQSDLASIYYSQRASAGLLITEAVAVSKQGSGYNNIPGIWDEAQIPAWQKVTNAVHAKGGKILMQLFHTGRVGHSSLFGEQPVSSSAIRPDGKIMNSSFQYVDYETPKALTIPEINDITAQFKKAAINANLAGFDGIEIHGANGYLIDQFLRDGANKRNDDYGGSLKNRTRLLFDILTAAIDVWGHKKVGLRLSPYNPFNSMDDSDPIKTFTYIAEELNNFPLSYLHLLEPIVDAQSLADANYTRITPRIHKAYKGVLIANGGLNLETANSLIENNGCDLVAFGTLFISNPDLVERLKYNRPLAAANKDTFYTGNEQGYIDYPVYGVENA